MRRVEDEVMVAAILDEAEPSVLTNVLAGDPGYEAAKRGILAQIRENTVAANEPLTEESFWSMVEGEWARFHCGYSPRRFVSPHEFGRLYRDAEACENGMGT